jgi:NAD(P)-dependent dehydrogenase (short-subunit alcohol dehydrogenase family)
MGIGRATALRFSQEGASVVINATHPEPAYKLLEEIQGAGGKGTVCLGDVGKKSDAKMLIDTAVKQYGRLDILVNNAGIYANELLHNMTDEQWDEIIRVNLTGTFYCCQFASEFMMKQHYGKIINVTSYAAIQGMPTQSNYSAAKAGIIGFTKALAKELGPHGITVNVIAPFAMTRLLENAPKDFLNLWIERTSLKRVGDPMEVAHLILFLASSESDYVTGQLINVDGGLSIG